MRGLYERLDELVPEGRRSETLVIYVYSKSDTEYERNLEFFVQNGMWEGDGCDYIIVVQQASCMAAKCEKHVMRHVMQCSCHCP